MTYRVKNNQSRERAGIGAVASAQQGRRRNLSGGNEDGAEAVTTDTAVSGAAAQLFETATLIERHQGSVFELFKSKGDQLGLPMIGGEGRLTLTTPSGRIVLSSERDGVRLTLSAPDRATLHTLQETVERNIDGRFGEAVERVWSLAEPGALPANITFATVLSVSRISPSYFRVRIADPSLGRFSRGGLHFRLLFAPSDHIGEWPAIGEDGRTQWPGGRSAWHRPVYTVRQIDPDHGEMEFDVVVHDNGRVSAWCETSHPGERVALMGPGGGWYPEARWLGLFGDETALPAIARILAAAPDHTRGAATIMIGHEDDIQTLAAPSGMTIRWLVRGNGQTLHDAVEAMYIPPSDRFVWFAGERSDVELVRRALPARGLNRSEFRAASYWAADDTAS